MVPPEFVVKSLDFDNLGPIPIRHTTEGDNVPPRIVISGWPSETKELALIVHDPDAPLPYGFTHWCVYGIEPTDQSVSIGDESSYQEGPNGLGEYGYTGPEPPRGHGVHHYYFYAYALNTKVAEPLSREDFLNIYGDSVLAQCRLVGTYERQ